MRKIPETMELTSAILNLIGDGDAGSKHSKDHFRWQACALIKQYHSDHTNYPFIHESTGFFSIDMLHCRNLRVSKTVLPVSIGYLTVDCTSFTKWALKHELPLNSKFDNSHAEISHLTGTSKTKPQEHLAKITLTADKLNIDLTDFPHSKTNLAKHKAEKKRIRKELSAILSKSQFNSGWDEGITTGAIKYSQPSS